MKSLQTVLSIAVLGTIIALSGCGGGGGAAEPVADKQLGLLSKVWKVKSSGGVLYGSGSVDSTANWTNFKLTISGTKGQAVFNYDCTGRPPKSVWKASGTWQFDATNTTTIKSIINRDDGVQVTYIVDASASNLQLTIANFTGAGYSRVSNVQGQWVFNLIPN